MTRTGYTAGDNDVNPPQKQATRADTRHCLGSLAPTRPHQGNARRARYQLTGISIAKLEKASVRR